MLVAQYGEQAAHTLLKKLRKVTACQDQRVPAWQALPVLLSMGPPQWTGTDSALKLSNQLPRIAANRKPFAR